MPDTSELLYRVNIFRKDCSMIQMAFGSYEAASKYYHDRIAEDFIEPIDDGYVPITFANMYRMRDGDQEGRLFHEYYHKYAAIASLMAAQL